MAVDAGSGYSGAGGFLREDDGCVVGEHAIFRNRSDCAADCSGRAAAFSEPVSVWRDSALVQKWVHRRTGGIGICVQLGRDAASGCVEAGWRVRSAVLAGRQRRHDLQQAARTWQACLCCRRYSGRARILDEGHSGTDERGAVRECALCGDSVLGSADESAVGVGANGTADGADGEALDARVFGCASAENKTNTETETKHNTAETTRRKEGCDRR